MDQVETKSTLFRHIEKLPPDPIFSINSQYQEDPRHDKVNLTIGYVAAPDGSPPLILPSVRDAMKEIAEKETTKNYFPMSGDKNYVEAVRKLVFHDLAQERTIGFGTAGGTAAIRLIAEFIYGQISNRVCFSSPTWPNHLQIFQRVGYQIDQYPYEAEKGIDFNHIVHHLSLLPEKTLVLLQPMCHNPTGFDFTLEEWKVLSLICKKHHLIPFFDSAYQGLGVGLNEDAEPIRLFVREGHEVFVANSFSKSMGVYGERVGAAFVVMHSNEYKENITSRMQIITRTQYSNPPRHGESIATAVLTNPRRREMWEKEVNEMRKRVVHFRKKFAEQFARITGRDCSYIANGHGFFCRLGLNPDQITQLKEKHGIYMTKDARINIAAINDDNFMKVLEAIQKVV